MFDSYIGYSCAAQELSTACDEKFLVDLNRLNQMNNFETVYEYLQQTFGKFDDTLELEYPNDVKVILIKRPKEVYAIALRKNQELYNRGWRLVEEIE